MPDTDGDGELGSYTRDTDGDGQIDEGALPAEDNIHLASNDDLVAKRVSFFDENSIGSLGES